MIFVWTVLIDPSLFRHSANHCPCAFPSNTLVMDPLPITTGVIALIQTCYTIASFVQRFAGATGAAGVESLRNDIESLSSQLQLVVEKCDTVSSIAPHVLEWMRMVMDQCNVTLAKLTALVSKFCGYNKTRLGQCKGVIQQVLYSNEVKDLQNEMAKYRQILHFCLTLIYGYLRTRMIIFADRIAARSTSLRELSTFLSSVIRALQMQPFAGQQNRGEHLSQP